MYTIDLLRGTKIPPQSRPIRIAIATMTLAVPLAIGLTVFGWYTEARAQIPAQERLLTDYEKRIHALADVEEFVESARKRKGKLADYVKDLALALPTHAPWSERIRAFVECVPPGLTVNRLHLSSKEVIKKMTVRAKAEKDANAKTKVNSQNEQEKLRIYTLEVGVYVPDDGKHTGSIQNLRNSLARSPAFGCDTQNMTTIISQPETLFGRPYTLHVFKCEFE